MPVSDRDKSILKHMLSYCADIEETVSRFGNSYEVFKEDKVYRNACSMCILQIGELGGHLSEDFRATHSQMPWSEIRGMRNVMAHAYGSISVQVTWESIQQDIPALKAFCLSAIEEL